MRLTTSPSIPLINYDFTDELYADFQRDVSKGISEGRIKYREDIVDDLEIAPEAFMGMLAGKNFGKLLVRVANLSAPLERKKNL